MFFLLLTAWAVENAVVSFVEGHAVSDLFSAALGGIDWVAYQRARRGLVPLTSQTAVLLVALGLATIFIPGAGG